MLQVSRLQGIACRHAACSAAAQLFASLRTTTHFEHTTHAGVLEGNSIARLGVCAKIVSQASMPTGEAVPLARTVTQASYSQREGRRIVTTVHAASTSPILARPNARLDSSGEVLVIKSRQQQNADNAEPDSVVDAEEKEPEQ